MMSTAETTPSQKTRIGQEKHDRAGHLESGIKTFNKFRTGGKATDSSSKSKKKASSPLKKDDMAPDGASAAEAGKPEPPPIFIIKPEN